MGTHILVERWIKDSPIVLKMNNEESENQESSSFIQRERELQRDLQKEGNEEGEKTRINCEE